MSVNMKKNPHIHSISTRYLADAHSFSKHFDNNFIPNV